MLAKEYSLKIEILLRSINPSIFNKSDEILRNPYEEIISAIQCRISQEKIKKFKFYYNTINGKSMQELLNDKYNIELLLTDLRKLVKNN